MFDRMRVKKYLLFIIPIYGALVFTSYVNELVENDNIKWFDIPVVNLFFAYHMLMVVYVVAYPLL